MRLKELNNYGILEKRENSSVQLRSPALRTFIENLDRNKLKQGEIGKALITEENRTNNKRILKVLSTENV